MLKKIKSLFINKNEKILREKIEKIEAVFPLLEEMVKKKSMIVEKISDDFFEAKKQIDSYRNEDGSITEYDGILLIQEVMEKLMIRFDYYFMNDGKDYPEENLNLRYSKTNISNNRNEKAAYVEKVLTRNNVNTISSE